MELIIVNPNGRTTVYGAELVKDARHAVKGLGRLTGYHVEVFEGTGAVTLVAHYQTKDGMIAHKSIRI